nr:peptidylprolyl isomerase [Pseudomaricurvus sp. HS19]
MDVAGLNRGDERVIVVDEQALSVYLTDRSGQFSDATLASLSPQERQALVDQYVRDEALFREALALGLDRDDAAIRRRLIQSLRFSLSAAGSEETGDAAVSEEELRSYYDANRQRYVQSASISYSQIFFDSDRRGRDAALAAARDALTVADGSDWLAMGDRYPYQRNRSAVTESSLQSEWGEAAARLFALPADGHWQGPIESPHGIHLVRIDQQQPRQEPDFEQLRASLTRGVLQQREEQAQAQAVARIAEGYRIEVAPALVDM